MNDPNYALCSFGLLLIIYLVPSYQFLLNESIFRSLPCQVTETEIMMKLDTSSFTSYKVKNIYQCVILAMKIEKAKSLNYNIWTNDCELNSRGIDSSGSLNFVADGKYVFIQFDRKTCRNNIDEKRVCDIGECKDIEACISVNSNKETLCKRMANGNWGSWSNYTQCSVSCGGGIQTRTRLCDNPIPMYGGKECKGSDTESQECNVSECPVNGNWGSWSTYSPCSLSCGGGIQTRSRSCDNPSPSYGGSICAGTPTENSDCNTAACPVNGNWGTWSSYNQCSVTCGGGTQTRSRSCDSPAPSNGGSNCPGSTTETQACNPSLCPVAGNWGDWSTYSQCTVTCGGGTKSRTRQCNNPSPSNGGAACVGSDTDNSACNASPCPAVVNGNWGTWSAYNQCSVTCGGGTQTRSRSCDSPAPSNGGSNCPGSTTESQACNPSLCPVNGNWGKWSSYNQCSVTCGGGTQTRSRSCDNPAPSNGGSNCPGSTRESQACNPTLCPVAGNWGDWSAYSQCTVTCGGGTKSRTRQCNNPSPSNGGAACEGSDTDNSACNASPCPDAVCNSKSGYDFDDNTRTCIKISSSNANFDNAKTACQSEGGTLFKMDSVGKRDVLDTLVKSQGMNSGGIFIGAKDVGTLEYKWLDGTSVNWIGNPPTTHNQDCVRYDIASQEMDETYCTNNLKYVCEQSV